ncbi:MAG: LCP family protein [Chloroflexales bacterium]|nr:LCP family protein [Chloroflexales bacterium]
MPFFSRRLVIGVAITLSLIVAATMLRLALEWRQALADIDSMIVTPAAIDLAADSPASESQTVDSTTSGQAPQPQAPGPEAAPTLSQESMNILLLGTDARPGDETTRTDAIVLVRIERDSGRVSMLSLPRDLWVSYPSGGEGRVNAAFAIGEKRFGLGGGAALAKSTVGRLVGVKVDNFVLINFQGFQTLIDQLGGITVNVPEAIYDPAYPTADYGTVEVHFRPGAQTLNGERALIYARTRHADSDFGRNQRQQLVLMAIFNRIRERGLLQQLTSLDDYTGAMRGYVQTDMSHSRMLEVASFARSISPDDVLRYAIDSSTIIDLRSPATFAAEPAALKRIVSQFTGAAVSTAGGK